MYIYIFTDRHDQNHRNEIPHEVIQMKSNILNVFKCHESPNLQENPDQICPALLESYPHRPPSQSVPCAESSYWGSNHGTPHISDIIWLYIYIYIFLSIISPYYDECIFYIIGPYSAIIR